MSEVMRQEPGWLLDLNAVPVGSPLIEDAPIGADTLYVNDVTDFDEGGGSIDLEGIQYGYQSTDPETDALILNGTLDEAYDADTFVATYDDERGQVEYTYDALVEFATASSDDDPIPASLSHALIPLVETGPREARGEPVLLEQYGTEWRIVDLRSKKAQLDLSDADEESLGTQPAAPENVTLSTNTFLDGKVARARIIAEWDEVVTDVEGNELEKPVTAYEVQITPGPGVGVTSWRQGAYTDDEVLDATMEPFGVGEQWAVRVRAKTATGNGEFSPVETITTAVDNDGPPQPKPPTVTSRLGVFSVTVEWLDWLGNPLPVDTAYVELHKSATAITPTPGDPGTLVDTFPQAGVVQIVGVYGTAAHFKTIAVDTSDNPSTPSTDVVSTPAQLVDVSNFPDSAMSVLYARTGHFIQLDADQINANSAAIGLLETGQLIGAIVQGGTFQTNGTPTSGGIRIRDLDGIRAWANGGGTPTFEIDRNTGLMTARGGNFTNGTISGGTITSAGAGGSVTISNGSVQFEEGSISDNSPFGITINGPGTGIWLHSLGIEITGTINQYGHQTLNMGGHFNMNGYNIQNVPSIGNAGGTIDILGTIKPKEVFLTDVPVASGGQEVYMGASGRIYARVAPSRAEWKHDVDEVTVDPDALAGLTPYTGRYNDDVPFDVDDPDEVHWGYMHGDAAELGLTDLIDVSRGVDVARPERLPLLLLAAWRQDHARLGMLEERLVTAGL